MQKITPFLWFDNNAREAAEFYKSIFPDSKATHHSPLVSEFVICGQQFLAMNGGPNHKFTDAISFTINCDSQEEVDMYWEKLTASGGKEIECGWLQDKYGLSWQVTPTILGKLMSDPDPVKAGKAMQAMLKMKKIIIQDLLDAVKI